MWDRMKIFLLAFAVACWAVGSGTAFAKKHEGETHPPGWTHGEKEGWGGESMPPGLFKKQGEEEVVEEAEEEKEE